MPRLLSLSFLVLSLAGQPLRQAEAAGDLTRILAHFADADGELEVPDGGVGDDSGVAVMEAEMGHAASAWCVSPGDLWAPPHRLSPSSLTPSSTPGLAAVRGRPGQVPWLPTRAGQRQAWLQLLQV
jgi:hypothetical protein